MYNMSMFHSLLLNEKIYNGYRSFEGIVVVIAGGGVCRWGGVWGFYLNERSSMYNKIKFRNQRRHPIYILVNRFLL